MSVHELKRETEVFKKAREYHSALQQTRVRGLEGFELRHISPRNPLASRFELRSFPLPLPPPTITPNQHPSPLLLWLPLK